MNQGIIFSAGIIYIAFNEKKHPVISGILLGFTSMKPQLALPFYALLLIRKSWKPFFIAIFIPFTFWIISSFLAATPPLEMLFQTIKMGSSYSNNSFFSGYQLLFGLDISSGFISLLSMIFCVLIFFYFIQRLKKGNVDDDLVYYSIPAVLSGMWFYSQEHDKSILAIYLIVLLGPPVIGEIKNNSIIYLLIFEAIAFPDLQANIQANFLFTSNIANAQLFYLTLRSVTLIIGLIVITECYVRNTEKTY